MFCMHQPNMAVKGARQSQALLEVGGLIGSSVSLIRIIRRATYFYVRPHEKHTSNRFWIAHLAAGNLCSGVATDNARLWTGACWDFNRTSLSLDGSEIAHR